jgi:DNA-nicking Smr family endonuclease
VSRRRGRDGRSLSDEDADLWRRATREAVPLARDDKAPTAPAPPVPPPADRPAPAVGGRKIPPVGRPETPPVPVPMIEPGRSPGLDRRTADRLRRGLMPIDGRIDLHGMYQAEAQGALVEFIQASAAAGLRCVLVITGRGSRSAGGMGILRAAVPDWLNRPACRGHVLAFAPAQPKHGGAGALYVLLRRKREPRS